MGKAVRGSDALLQAYKAGSTRLDDKFVGRLAERFADLPIHDILIKGQPHPDFLRATFVLGSAERQRGVIDELLGLLAEHAPGLGGLRVFPRGIPWPEEFLVDLTVGQQQLHV